MSSYENITGFADAITVTNTISDGLLAVGLPVVVWVALFGWNLRHGRAEAISYASFAVGIILIVENVWGLVEYWVVIADLLLLALGVFMIMLERREG